MRLDKMLANIGFGSRKEVRQLIKKGHVFVNGEPARTVHLKVNIEKDQVRVKDQEVNYVEHIYMMLHKPAGYVSATRDAKEKTVIDLLPKEVQHYAPFPVGRLDKDTEGLLLLTNDGKLAHILTSPRRNIPKTYYARIDGVVTSQDVEAFKKGVPLDDGYVTKPAILNILRSGEISEIELTITEGKFHQVKRMFLSVNKQVTYLKRIKMGALILDQELKKGQSRHLTPEELTYCQSLKEGVHGSTH